MTRAVRVGPTPSTALPGDESLTVEPGEGDADPRAIVGAISPPGADGVTTVEVLVDGWRFELAVEDEGRAALRERATRDRGGIGTGGGPAEIRAIIPGRVAAVAVVAGDQVEAGQALLVVEAMKMQNELRAPRAGTVDRVAVTAGQTIEVGDLLVVLA